MVQPALYPTKDVGDRGLPSAVTRQKDLAISGSHCDAVKSRRLHMRVAGCACALLMVVLFTTGNPAPALAGRDEALVDAVTGAFTAEQMSSLIASATGRGDPRTGQAAQSLEQLQLLLGVGRDVVRHCCASSTARIFDRTNRPGTGSIGHTVPCGNGPVGRHRLGGSRRPAPGDRRASCNARRTFQRYRGSSPAA